MRRKDRINSYIGEPSMGKNKSKLDSNQLAKENNIQQLGGDTHEEGGISLGQNTDGQQVEAEGGELGVNSPQGGKGSKTNMVLSNNPEMSFNKKDIEQFGLPKGAIGQTPAKVLNDVIKKNDIRKNDRITNAMIQDYKERIITAQEAKRQERIQKALADLEQLQPGMMDQMAQQKAQQMQGQQGQEQPQQQEGNPQEQQDPNAQMQQGQEQQVDPNMQQMPQQGMEQQDPNARQGDVFPRQEAKCGGRISRITKCMSKGGVTDNNDDLSKAINNTQENSDNRWNTENNLNKFQPLGIGKNNTQVAYNTNNKNLGNNNISNQITQQTNPQFDDIRNLPNNVNNANYKGLVNNTNQNQVTTNKANISGTDNEVTPLSNNINPKTDYSNIGGDLVKNMVGEQRNTSTINNTNAGIPTRLNQQLNVPQGNTNTLQAPKVPLRQGVGDALKLGFNNVKDKFKKVTGIGNNGENGGLPLGIGYDLTRGIMKTINPDKEKYQNVNVTPINPELMNYDQAKVDINTQTANTNEAAKNAPNMASYLAMRMGSDNAAAGQVANVAQQTENTNVGIKNNAQAQNAQAMNQASTQNAAINNQAHVDTDQNKANAMNITQGALANWDTVRSVRSRDKKADEIENMVANNLGTKDYNFHLDRKNMANTYMTYTNTNGQTVTANMIDIGNGVMGWKDATTGQTYTSEDIKKMMKDKGATTQTTNTTTTQPVNTN